MSQSCKEIEVNANKRYEGKDIESVSVQPEKEGKSTPHAEEVVEEE